MRTLLAAGTRPAASLRRAWWALPLRLIVGLGFMEHGYAKLASGSGPFAFDSILLRPRPPIRAVRATRASGVPPPANESQ